MQTITVEELKAKIDNGETLHLVDVREPHEHAEFNIGGILLPLGKVQTMQRKQKWASLPHTLDYGIPKRS